MPKDFDESKLGFSVGQYNSSDYSDVYYNIENVDGKKVISGNLDRRLFAGGSGSASGGSSSSGSSSSSSSSSGGGRSGGGSGGGGRSR